MHKDYTAWAPDVMYKYKKGVISCPWGKVRPHREKRQFHRILLDQPSFLLYLQLIFFSSLQYYTTGSFADRPYFPSSPDVPCCMLHPYSMPLHMQIPAMSSLHACPMDSHIPAKTHCRSLLTTNQP